MILDAIRERVVARFTMRCRIERPRDAVTTIDPVTLKATVTTPVVYEGGCLLRWRSASQDQQIADRSVSGTSLILRLPVGTDVRPDDDVVITESPDDPILVGKQYRVAAPHYTGTAATMQVEIVEIGR